MLEFAHCDNVTSMLHQKQYHCARDTDCKKKQPTPIFPGISSSHPANSVSNGNCRWEDGNPTNITSSKYKKVTSCYHDICKTIVLARSQSATSVPDILYHCPAKWWQVEKRTSLFWALGGGLEILLDLVLMSEGCTSAAVCFGGLKNTNRIQLWAECRLWGLLFMLHCGGFCCACPKASSVTQDQWHSHLCCKLKDFAHAWHSLARPGNRTCLKASCLRL